MAKMSLTNNQTAFEYALYMIASSYFDRVKCKNTILEKSMLLQYKEQKLDNQYKMEDICIAYMDGLQQKLPKDLFKQNTVVRFRKRQNGFTTLFFMSRKYVLEIQGIYAGKKSAIDCSLWQKAGRKRKRAD